jgi:hypothetical protein
MKFINIFLLKKAKYVKKLDFLQKILWSRYRARARAGAGTVTCQKLVPESEP